uniref:Putative secreted peptide n=1 Tax=Anopheles braziliensis TaxID=58242 RepID=A0A2M3ZR90_9DIPT
MAITVLLGLVQTTAFDLRFFDQVGACFRADHVTILSRERSTITGSFTIDRNVLRSYRRMFDPPFYTLTTDR